MIESMFHIPLVRLKVTNWNEKKNNLLYLYDKILPNIELNDKIFTNFDQNKFQLIKDIEFIFQEEIQQFSRELSLNHYFVLNAWFELACKNSYHTIHNHGGLGYSSVCFIKFNSKHHTPTKFISPFLNFLTGDTIHYYPSDIEEGSIIFFPSAINHYTDPNMSDEERLIVSFNLDVK